MKKTISTFAVQKKGGLSINLLRGEKIKDVDASLQLVIVNRAGKDKVISLVEDKDGFRLELDPEKK